MINIDTSGTVFKEAVTHEEKYQLARMRYDIYIQEIGKNIQKGLDHKKKIIWAEEDKYSKHFYVEKKEEGIIATMRLQTGDMRSLEPMEQELLGIDDLLQYCSFDLLAVASRFMVVKKYRKSLIGFDLLKEIIKYTTSNVYEIIAIFGFSIPKMLPYYYTIGSRLYKDCVYYPDRGIRYPIVFLNYDSEYLERINSPVLVPVEKKPTNFSMDIYRTLFPNLVNELHPHIDSELESAMAQ